MENNNLTHRSFKVVQASGDPPDHRPFKYDEYVLVQYNSGHYVLGRVLQGTFTSHHNNRRQKTKDSEKLKAKVLVYRKFYTGLVMMTLAGQNVSSVKNKKSRRWDIMGRSMLDIQAVTKRRKRR